MRAETGRMEFEGDWTGVFIRGDNALMLYAPALQSLLDGDPQPMTISCCWALLDLLQSCDARATAPTQRAALLPAHKDDTP